MLINFNKLIDSIVKLRQVISSEINNNYELTKMPILNVAGFPQDTHSNFPDLNSLHLNDGKENSTKKTIRILMIKQLFF